MKHQSRLNLDRCTFDTFFKQNRFIRADESNSTYINSIGRMKLTKKSVTDRLHCATAIVANMVRMGVVVSVSLFYVTSTFSPAAGFHSEMKNVPVEKS